CCGTSAPGTVSSTAASGSSADRALVLKIRTNFRFFRPRVKSQKLEFSLARAICCQTMRRYGSLRSFPPLCCFTQLLHPPVRCRRPTCRHEHVMVHRALHEVRASDSDARWREALHAGLCSQG